MTDKIKPQEDEGHGDFMQRCMGSGTMNEEYPDSDQRYAVCQSIWDDKGGKKMPIKNIKIKEREDDGNSFQRKTGLL